MASKPLWSDYSAPQDSAPTSGIHRWSLLLTHQAQLMEIIDLKIGVNPHEDRYHKHRQNYQNTIHGSVCHNDMIFPVTVRIIPWFEWCVQNHWNSSQKKAQLPWDQVLPPRIPRSPASVSECSPALCPPNGIKHVFFHDEQYIIWFLSLLLSVVVFHYIIFAKRSRKVLTSFEKKKRSMTKGSVSFHYGLGFLGKLSPTSR